MIKLEPAINFDESHECFGVSASTCSFRIRKTGENERNIGFFFLKSKGWTLMSAQHTDRLEKQINEKTLVK